MLKIIVAMATLVSICFAVNQTLVNLPADSWYQAPNTPMTPVCAPNANGYGCLEVMAAWSGAAYDPTHRLLIVWGGGHVNSDDNSVYVFSIDSMKWTRLINNTGSMSSSDPLANGDPISRHTYGGLAYVTHANRFFACGGAIAGNGGNTTVTWTLNVASKAWQNMRPSGTTINSSFTYNTGCAYDPVSKLVAYSDIKGILTYDYDKNLWTRKMDSQCWDKHLGVMDTKRGIYFAIGAAYNATDCPKTWIAYDVRNSKDVTGSWTVTGAPSSLGQVAGDYDTKADCIVAWNGGGPYVLDMNTKTWTRKNGTGCPANPSPANGGGSTGTYGRFRYVPEENVFILANSTSENVYFYKHTAGLGTKSESGRGAQLATLMLSSNPNPFNPATAISFNLPAASKVSLSVYDMTGKKVAALMDGTRPEGLNQIAFDATRHPAGVYVCRLSAGNLQSSMKLFLMK